MSHYIQNGSQFRVTPTKNLDVKSSLPVGTYVIEIDPRSNEFYLQTVDNFSINFKLYANLPARSARILNTFTSRPSGTGVMLSGEKGSGKTLLAKKISIDAAASGIPTILVNRAYYGPQFNSFIQSIDHPAVLFFDEFEKVYYENEAKENILTLLDGAFPSKKLFLLTVNDPFRTDVHMKNRPGRIFYTLEFTGLDEKFIREYCEDTLGNKTFIEEIVLTSKLFSSMNFDMLAAWVEEINRYGETPKEALEFLNVKPQYGERKHYQVQITFNGKECQAYYSHWEGNIFSDEFKGSYKILKPKEKVQVEDTVLSAEDNGDVEFANDDNWKTANLSIRNLVSFSEKAITLRDKELEVVLVRKAEPEPSEFLKRFLL